MSDNWQAQVSYTWAKAYGLLPSSGFGGASSSQSARVYGGSLARDPNQFINAAGNLLNDRTHTFRVTGDRSSCLFEVLFGFNGAFFNGKPWAHPWTECPRRSYPRAKAEPCISKASGFDRRLENQTLLDLRLSKSAFFFGPEGTTKIEPFVDIAEH